MKASWSLKYTFLNLHLGMSSKLEDLAISLIEKSVTTIPDDVKFSLRKALKLEDNGVARRQLEIILENIEKAELEKLPVCQDTGVFTFHLNLDPSVYNPMEVKEALTRALIKATFKIPLRPNVVDPFTRRNSGNNVGLGIPHFEWEFNREGFLKVTVVPKGAGSENVTKLCMMPPYASLRDIAKFVIDSVVQAGGAPCPPLILGLGIGGLAEVALKLAKKASLRSIDQHSQDEKLRRLEAFILERVNETELGVMGLGGRTTALAVHIEHAYTHTASMPVALAFQCWASRRATLRLEGPI